jgi:hypothetical protein
MVTIVSRRKQFFPLYHECKAFYGSNLLLTKKLAQTQWTKTCFIPVSMGWPSGSGSLTGWNQDVDWNYIHFKVHLEQSPLSSLLVAFCRIWCLLHSWTERFSSSLAAIQRSPTIPCHAGVFMMQITKWLSTSSKQAKERDKSVSKKECWQEGSPL